MPNQPCKDLDTFDNPSPDADYTIRICNPEFTCLCPNTGQPDFATLHIEYVPDRLCIELKSLKLYIWSYRDRGAYHEAVTNQILRDLVQACEPRFQCQGRHHHHRGGRTPGRRLDRIGTCAPALMI